jgi:hypothetical protein
VSDLHDRQVGKKDIGIGDGADVRRLLKIGARRRRMRARRKSRV